MTATTRPPKLRVLFFDVFGTCVAQRTPVADELWKAAREALESDRSRTSMSREVRAKAAEMSYEQWFEFGGEWNQAENEFVRGRIAEHGTVDWRAVDKHRIESLPRLLARRGLIILREDPDEDKDASESSSAALRVRNGSLWNASQLQHLGQFWHRLPPWPDTLHGLDLLNRHFTTVALSNTYTDLLTHLVAHSHIPFNHLYAADMFHSFKPDPAVYLGAAGKMGVKPEECALVAAHLNDLKGAKACGFYTIYVERPWEEKNPELKGEQIPDLVVREGEEGLVALAGRLGFDIG